MGGAILVGATPFPVSAVERLSDEHDKKKIYYAYRSFWPELEMTSTFKKMGINSRCFFASNTINSAGFEYCKYPLIWLGIKKYDFTAYDKMVIFSCVNWYHSFVQFKNVGGRYF